MSTQLTAANTADESAVSNPAQRLGRRYCFADSDMDLFFMAALGWGPSGGLDAGQIFYVADQIKDGDGDSWVHAFTEYGERLDAEADGWLARGHRRNTGETRLKAFAAYRSAWQFAGPGERFAALIGRQRAAFGKALPELGITAQFFDVPYAAKQLPGVFLPATDPAAPIALIIGGADTSFEDLFLTLGRSLLDRGYAVALADLPGQGLTQADGLHWEAEAEKPISAVIDVLVDRFEGKPGRIALIGLSLGGYFVARAAGYETRLATVIASTPFPDPAQLFALSVQAALRDAAAQATPAAQRSRAVTFWKAGATTAEQFIDRTRNMVADPKRVTLPFLSILGAGDSPVFASQAEAWHRDILSTCKSFVRLDAASGADGHVQVNNRLRLAQECGAWMDEVFGRMA
ncbi:alpha/beta hydrolase family protein [uncultured Nostoc sp.]|uniref:alpha/beta hydrolase family protein n=1 Tax=uncultured Nostoc sp. TaxID=340711 RepID=UPI0035C956D0